VTQVGHCGSSMTQNVWEWRVRFGLQVRSLIHQRRGSGSERWKNFPFWLYDEAITIEIIFTQRAFHPHNLYLFSSPSPHFTLRTSAIICLQILPDLLPVQYSPHTNSPQPYSHQPPRIWTERQCGTLRCLLLQAIKNMLHLTRIADKTPRQAMRSL
jgi:hypothetical protein